MVLLRRSRTFAGVCGLFILLLMCAGCGGPTPRPSASASPTNTQANIPTGAPTPIITPISITSQPPPAANGPLGPAPTNCSASAPLQTITYDNFGGGFSSPISFQGGGLVWQLGLGSAAVHLSHDTSDPYSSTKIMWVVGPNYSHSVTLSGHELQSGTPLWFDIYPSNGAPSNPSIYTTQAPLDPAAPNRGSTDNSTGHWNIWGIGIIALTAGCYELDASWSGGGWQAIYAIGS